MDIAEIKGELDHLNDPKIMDSTGFDIVMLGKDPDPRYWFLFLKSHPKFAPDSNWWFDLRNRCDLPWSQLLAAQPQFEEYWHWESVSRVEIILLAYRAPEIFKRKFPQGRAHDLYSILTSLEKSRLLSQLPEYAEYVDWDEINAEFSIGEWFGLLADQPQFERYFDWSKVEKQPNHYWDMLLKKQPQFAIHCDFEQLYPNQRHRLVKLFEIKE